MYVIGTSFGTKIKLQEISVTERERQEISGFKTADYFK